MLSGPRTVSKAKLKEEKTNCIVIQLNYHSIYRNSFTTTKRFKSAFKIGGDIVGTYMGEQERQGMGHRDIGRGQRGT